MREMLGRKNIQPPSCLRCTVLRKERLSSQRRQRGYNKLTFILEIPRYLKNTFVERSTQYTSFSSRKQPANAGTERKQFTENASVALQQPILTHAHTKCPPVHVRQHSRLKNSSLLRMSDGTLKERSLPFVSSPSQPPN